MTAIFGILHRQGSPVPPEPFAAMQQALAVWGADGAATWCGGALRAGAQIFHNTPESVHERLPVMGAGGSTMLLAHARLDNREELCRWLEIDAAERPQLADSTLLARAYERWGEQCAPRFRGDWSMAVWDARRRTLFLAHDYLSHAGLYYYATEHLFVFASSIPAVLAHPDVPRVLRPISIAQLSSYGKRDVATCYEGVNALPPGHILTIAASECRLQAYWSPEEISKVRYRNQDEYREHFLQVYETAVRTRLRSRQPIGVMLSGGLDSSSVAALAAPELARRGGRLASFTAVPRYGTTAKGRSHRILDERAQVEAICAHVGNIDPTFVPTSTGPLASLEWILQVLGQPSYAAASDFWRPAVLQQARTLGIGTILTGDFGNMTVSWGGQRGVDPGLLLPDRWLELAAQARDWRVANDASHLETLKRYFARPLRQALRDLVRTPSSRVRSVVRGAASKQALRRGVPANAALEELRRRTPQPLQSIVNLYQSGAAAIAPELSAALGMELRVPTLDQSVVEFCIGAPEDCFVRNHRSRLLIRESMQGRLPHDVLWNQRRGLIASDIDVWARNEREAIEDMLERLQKSSLACHWLNVRRMRSSYRRLLARTDATAVDGFGTTLRGLAVGLFLLRFDHA